jgi:uncharacterized membrane protein
MKRTTSAERWLGLLVLLMTLWSTASLAAQSPTFSLRVLDNLSGVGGAAVVNGINDAGEAVGSASGGSSSCTNGCAVIWRDGTPTMLGPVSGAIESGAYSINDAGQIAGIFSTGPSIGEPIYQAVIWNNGMPTLLPSPGPQYIETIAASINNSGQVAGSALTAFGGEPVAVVWNGLTPTILGTTPGCSYGAASGINNGGLVVGTLYCSYGLETSLPVFWRGTTATRLPVHPTVGTVTASTAAVNDLELIVGMSNDAANPDDAPFEATAWANGVVTNLGPFPKIQGYSTATAVNNHGIIVGEASFDALVDHAALWSPIGTAPQDLNQLISPAVAKLYVLTGATGINDSCTIVANGYDKKTLANEAFMLKLIDPSNCVKGLVAPKTGN